LLGLLEEALLSHEAEYEREAGVSGYEGLEQQLLARFKNKSYRSGEQHERGLLPDRHEVGVADHDLGTLAHKGLLVEWRVEVTGFIGQVQHALEEQFGAAIESA